MLPKVKANEPDILLRQHLRPGPRFVRQPGGRPPASSAIRIGFEFTPDGVNASKGTYDSDGYTFAYDYFDADEPERARWPRCSSSEFNADNGEDPDFYAANFYENAFVMWEVMRRIWAKDREADITGDALDKALQENLTVVSVYGGDDAHRRHLHPRPDDPLGDEARDGRVRVQGRHGHAEGVLRHRRRRLQAGLTAHDSRRLEGAVDRCWQSTFETFRQLTVDGFFRGCSYGLLGVGFALILGVTGRFHFAYGFTYTLAAYLAFTFTFRCGSWPFWPSAILGVLLSAVVGARHRARRLPPARPQRRRRPRCWRCSSPPSASASPARTSSGCFWGSNTQAYFGPRKVGYT